MTGIQILCQLLASFGFGALAMRVGAYLIPDSLADMADPPDPWGQP